MSVEGHNSITHHFWRLRNTELSEIYFFMSFRTFALSMVSVFVPIYFLTQGISIQWILIYFLILYGGGVFLQYPTSMLIKKFGPKVSVVLSVPLLIIHLFLIRAVGNSHISLIWPAVFAALEMPLFWQGYHLDFVLSKTSSKAARQVAVVAILIAIAGALAPFVGGLISSLLGLGVVIVFSSLLLTAGGFVLFLPTKQERVSGVNYDFKSFKLRKIKRDLLANAGSGIDTAGNAIFWPLFVFLIVGSYKAVGLVTSIGLVATILLTWYIGKKADNGERKKYIKYGDVTSAVLDVVQAFVQNVFHILFVNVFGSFSASMKNAPYTSEYYLRASESGAGPYIFYMETVINLARVLMLLILLGLSWYLPLKTLCIAAFGLSAIGAGLGVLMPQSRLDIRQIKRLEKAEISLSRRPVSR